MPDGDLLLVRNMMKGPTVFEDPKTQQSYEWQGHGDRAGEDVQYVPGALLSNPHFKRHLDRKIFVVEEANEEVMQQLAAQQLAYQQRQQAEIEASIEHIDQSARNDIMGIGCVGPGPRGGQCGVAVPIREKEAKDRPPLCQMHEHLAGQYVPTEHPTEVDGEGKPTVLWVTGTFGSTALPSQQ